MFMVGQKIKMLSLKKIIDISKDGKIGNINIFYCSDTQTIENINFIYGIDFEYIKDFFENIFIVKEILINEMERGKNKIDIRLENEPEGYEFPIEWFVPLGSQIEFDF